MHDQASNLRSLVQSAGETGGAVGTMGGVRVLERSTEDSGSAARRESAAFVSLGPSAVKQQKQPIRLAHAVAVCSGKGGVGKSNISINLAVALSQFGLRVCVLDADLGMANADVLCNLTPNVTLEHVISGRARLVDAMVAAPGGFRLIPGASGVAGVADLGPMARHRLLEQLSVLDRSADVLLIDIGAGIGANVVDFAAAAHTTLVVTTPEPTAITDAYGMIKSLCESMPNAQIELAVNMADSWEEGRDVYERINRVCRTFLRREIALGGVIPRDTAVINAVKERVPFMLTEPDGLAARAIVAVGRGLIGLDRSAAFEVEGGFFSRLAGRMGSSREKRKFQKWRSAARSD